MWNEGKQTSQITLMERGNTSKFTNIILSRTQKRNITNHNTIQKQKGPEISEINQRTTSIRITIAISFRHRETARTACHVNAERIMLKERETWFKFESAVIGRTQQREKNQSPTWKNTLEQKQSIIKRIKQRYAQREENH
jgi:hypothetical protein